MFYAVHRIIEINYTKKLGKDYGGIMDIFLQKKQAKEFADNWATRGDEKQDTQSFWIDFLEHVLGVRDYRNYIEFEKRVELEHTSFIDVYIPKTHVIIEQKSKSKDLGQAIKQSDGSSLTPFEQAKRYSDALPYNERARWIVTCNFSEFWIYDMQKPNEDPEIIKLENLAKEYYRLEFLVDATNDNIEEEKRISLDAGVLVGKIYDSLLKQYKDPDSERTQKSINQLCVRLVFCLYAEDAGIFGRKKMFHDYLSQYDARGMRQALIKLFKVLDQKEEDRDTYLADDDPKLAEFPYVNGGMFENEDIEIPPFTDELRDLILRNASDDFDWSDISPTIFGAVFESTLNPETRRQGGMHYTSVENIHKVIDPLFLDDLKEELNKIKSGKQINKLKNDAKNFQVKLSQLKFFDPACGSGNFLTETYLQLRKLENEAIKLQIDNPMLDTENRIMVSINQFYGIEINDFAVSVAKTAMWIAESQMWEETRNILYANDNFLPLKTYVNIKEGNALRMDWNEVLPNYQCSYIMGNPPFLGYKQQDKEQKDDLLSLNIKSKNIDYVLGWYVKAVEYMKNTKIKCAFVSTNSITQGEQVPAFWRSMIQDHDVDIILGYRSFVWDNEATAMAHVHVVIIGFTVGKITEKKLLIDNDQKEIVNVISPYLTATNPSFIENRPNPINTNAPKMIYGSEPREGNFLILSPEEANEFKNKYPDYQRFVKPYVSSKDFIHNEYRYCLWLVDATPAELQKNKFISKRLEQVREYRENSKQKQAHAMANTPWLFTSIRQPKTDYLLIPIVSSENRRYIPIGYVDSNIIASNACYMLPNTTLYDFSILESNMHMAWMRTVAGRLKSDYRYSAKIVYNNFPWPNPTKKQKEKIEQTAQGILDARAKYPESSLAELYDRLTMPKELLKAHEANDKAVMDAYGIPWGTSESDIVAILFQIYQELAKKE